MIFCYLGALQTWGRTALLGVSRFLEIANNCRWACLSYANQPILNPYLHLLPFTRPWCWGYYPSSLNHSRVSYQTARDSQYPRVCWNHSNYPVLTPAQLLILPHPFLPATSTIKFCAHPFLSLLCLLTNPGASPRSRVWCAVPLPLENRE